MKIIIFILLSMIFISLNAEAVDLKFAGCLTIFDNVLKEAKQVFENKTGYRIGVSGGGSKGGINAVLNGMVDIGMVSRDLSKDELAQGLHVYNIGWTAIVLIVNKGIIIDNLTSQEIRDIMTGRIKNWKEVGGPYLPVKVILCTKGCASREKFQETIVKDEYFYGAIVTPENTISDTVSNITGSIAPAGLVAVDKSKVRILKIDGVYPSLENIKAKKYKVIAQINLITKGPAQGKVKEFIDFMLSPEGQEIVKRNGFLGVR